jgi:succinate dehydrogenase / fumarate reductase iron-sulfur subunit
MDSAKSQPGPHEKSVAVEFRILRYQPGSGQEPVFQSYQLDIDSGMTVLDALEKIRLTLDPTLMYRHSCHHSACGTCACMINGSQRLACITNVQQLNSPTVVLEPLKGLPCMGDLVVDMTGFYSRMSPDWSLLRNAEPIAEGDTRHARLENCIECGACVSACPVCNADEAFMGPAALAALNTQRGKVRPSRAEALLELASGPEGERKCDRALACSRVCPTRVYPARHIADLRRALHKPENAKSDVGKGSSFE